MPEIPVRCRAVSLVAVRKHGGADEVLLLKRTRSLRDEWCQIAGTLEEGETAWQAALRELAEETRLRPAALYSADICEQFYEAQLDAVAIIPVFVAYIEPTAEVQLNEEHSEHRWVSFEEARSMVPFAGQRHVLRHVEVEFMHADPNRHLQIVVE